MNELIAAVGKYAAEKGETWRIGEGAEIMDAYNAAITPRKCSNPDYKAECGCWIEGSGCPEQQIHPRQLLILRNNHAMFMERAQKTTDWDYKAQCVAGAQAAAKEIERITGKSFED